MNKKIIPSTAQQCNTKTPKKRGRPTKHETITLAIRIYNYIPDMYIYTEDGLAKRLKLDLTNRRGRGEVRSAKKWLEDNGYIRVHRFKLGCRKRNRIEKLKGDRIDPVSREEKAQLAAERDAKQFQKRRIRYHIDTLDLRCGGDSALAVEAFRSVGVRHLEFYWLDQDRSRSTCRHMAELLLQNREKRLDLGGRPFGAPVIQIDDVPPELLPRLEPLSFITIQTSLQSFHCWLAMSSGTADAELREVTDRLFKALEGTKANEGANGCSRWPDTINWKPEHNGFVVRVKSWNQRGTITRAKLIEHGLQAEIPVTIRSAKVKRTTYGKASCFPDYERCLREKGGKRRNADASFARMSLERGFSDREVKAELNRVSEKVRSQEVIRHSDYYLDKTIAKAHQWLNCQHGDSCTCRHKDEILTAQ